MSKHSPGPWKWDDCGVLEDADRNEVMVLSFMYQTPNEEAMTLVAAAPTLKAERDEAMDLLREALACVDQEDYRLSDRICAFFARVDGGQT